MARTSATFGVSGQKALLKEFEKLGGIVKGSEVVDFLVDAARPIKAEAERRVPVLTGLLKKAIFISARNPFRDARGPSILIGVSSKKAPHAHLVELGTKYQEAQPFMRGAVLAKRKQVGQKVGAGIKTLIKKYS